MSWVDTFAELDGLQARVRALERVNAQLSGMCATYSDEIRELRAQLDSAAACESRLRRTNQRYGRMVDELAERCGEYADEIRLATADLVVVRDRLRDVK